MSVPTLSDVKTFFEGDALISSISDTRLTFWLNDVANKKLVDETAWGDLYFNGFMNLLGHYLLVYQLRVVSYFGAVTSNQTAQVSKSFSQYNGTSPTQKALYMTIYGTMYLSLLNQLPSSHGGAVAGYYSA